MAADSGMTLLPLPTPAVAAPSGPRSALIRASTSSPAAAEAESASRAAARANASASQRAQSSADPSAGAQDHSGDAGSNACGSKQPSAKANPAKSDESSRDSRDARRAARAARAAGASSGSAAKAAPRGTAASDDFSAALAQSLAATPGDRPAPAHAAPETASAGSGSEASARPAKHSAADPGPDALALLENAWAGVLVGAPPTPAAAPTGSAAGAGGIWSQSGQSAPAARSTAAALESQLALSLPTDAKGAASAASRTDASAAAVSGPTGAAAAALTASQLAAAVHVGSQPAKRDPMPMTLSSPVGSNAWTDELGTKLTWMAHQGIESASLQVSPDHLGPLQVSISVHNGQASVWFGAAQPDTRTALQQSLPQLRQLFANQGLTLADAGVSRESPREQGRQSPARAVAAAAGVAAVSLDASGGRAAVAGGLGLVDTYV